MTCRSVRAKVEAYQDGLLPADQALALEQHLRGCEACARECAELRGVVTLLEGLAEIEPPVGLTASVLRAVAHERVADARRPWVSPGLALAAVGLVLSTVIVTGLAGWGPVDLSGWQAGIAPLTAALAKLWVPLAEASGPVANALFGWLAGPVAWLLVADVVALLAVLAVGRRLLAARSPRNVTSLFAL